MNNEKIIIIVINDDGVVHTCVKGYEYLWKEYALNIL